MCLYTFIIILSSHGIGRLQCALQNANNNYELFREYND